jgi:translation initiation factor 5B
MSKIRSPIIVTVGHIDHGKTTLLDKIRGTTVTKAEPGQLSQHVGASYIPIETVKKISGELLKKFKIEITIPGLLLLDTPGHAAFITLRRRGGAVSDLAILVVDINEGFQEQTDESLAVLKEFKTPFVIAATKIDRIPGWNPQKNISFLDSFKNQREGIREEVDNKIYNLVAQLAERGFSSERYDRIDDFKKTIAIVPVSSITGEGIPDLLTVISGLAQQFLKDRLQLSDSGKGTVLEVKETKGFGITADVILYDGTLKRGDMIVVSGAQMPFETKVKALLEPRPLQEMRLEKQFQVVDEVSAAYGVKVAAPNLENIIAGSPVIVVKNEADIERAKEEVQKEVAQVQFEKDIDGVVVKADTLGSLEAMIKLLQDAQIPIKKAEVGNVSKQDLIALQNISDNLRKAVLAFNVKILEDAENLAKDWKIMIFQNNVVYRIIDEYKEWTDKKKKQEIEEKLASVVHPFELKFLKGFVFRVSNPAIFGVEVKKGILKKGVLVRNRDGKIVGKIKAVQREGKDIDSAKAGDKVAVSMEEPTIGRQIQEGETLTSVIPEEDLKILIELKEYLNLDEVEMIS